MRRFVPVLLLLAAGVAFAARDHDDNPLLKELLKEGIDIGTKARVALPAPKMSDGLSAAEQQKVLEGLVRGIFELADFIGTPKSTAPAVLRIDNVKPFDPKAPARSIDFYFVAFGNWKKVADKEFLERAWSTSASDTKSHTLTAAELAKRNITEKPNDSYGHGTFSLFNKVQISTTGHSTWSKTDQSFIIAGTIDPRFDKDAQFPNQWRSMDRDDDGKITYGPPVLYHGAGYYIKMTRLQQPEGAMLIEGHIIFTEPFGWFNGENYLRSKLPLAMRDQVMRVRKEFLKTMP